MKPGFVPALGTPFDQQGKFIKESYQKQIDDQIRAGAVAILCMGSMGIQPYIATSEYPKVAQAAVEAAAGRVPVFVGAMDTSICRAKDRMAAMEDLDIAGFVFTTPFYYSMTYDQVINYYKAVAAATKHKILMYDLAVVTQTKITYPMVLQLLREVPNLAGIKSADLQMFRKLKLNPDVPDDFIMVYSGLDTFDIAYKWGITNQLDGMLSCTPANTGKLFKAMEAGDFTAAAKYLDNITSLRDVFVANDLWPSFTASMNMLGYEGDFGPDYVSPVKPQSYEAVRAELVRIGEL